MFDVIFPIPALCYAIPRVVERDERFLRENPEREAQRRRKHVIRKLVRLRTFWSLKQKKPAPGKMSVFGSDGYFSCFLLTNTSTRKIIRMCDPMDS